MVQEARIKEYHQSGSNGNRERAMPDKTFFWVNFSLNEKGISSLRNIPVRERDIDLLANCNGIMLFAAAYARDPIEEVSVMVDGPRELAEQLARSITTNVHFDKNAAE
jgi:hypothetical protein